MSHVPALRKPRRARRSPVGEHIVAFVLAGVMAVLEPVRAEPIVLGASAAEASAAAIAAGSAIVADALPSDPADELTLPAVAQSATTTSGIAPGDTSSPASAGKQATNARAPQPPGPDTMTKAGVPDGVSRSSALPLTATGGDAAEGEPDWAYEVKEAIRPIYDELAASGVVDAVQGFRFYLAMLGVYLSNEHVIPSGQSVRLESVAEPHGGATSWGTRGASSDALLGPSEAQIKREKLIAALIMEEWFAAALPWIYGLAVLFIIWQIARLGLAFIRSRSAHRRRRAAKSSRHSAASARMRARS